MASTFREFPYAPQGRVIAVSVTKNASGVATRAEKTTYDYDDSENRISAKSQTDTNADGSWDTTNETTCLTTAQNDTG